MKKLICISLILALLLSTCVFAFAESDANNIYAEPKLIFNFYDYVHIQSREDLEKNIIIMNQYCESQNNYGIMNANIVYVTVALTGDFTATEEYGILVAGKDEAVKNGDEAQVNEAINRLNEKSKEYHKNLYDDNAYLIDLFDYETIHVFEYAPYVELTIDYQKISADLLESFIEKDSIAWIELSRNEEATVDGEINSCSCICHSDGFMSIFWKILRFFFKTFGINKKCECGVSHY